MSNSRLLFIGLLISAYFFIISVALFDRIILHKNELEPQKTIASKTKSLPQIYDRNGFLLATTLPTASIYANPHKISDPKKVATDFTEKFPEFSWRYIYKKLTSKENFVWIKKHLTPSEQLEFLYLGIPGLYLEKDEKRVYITENLFSHVIGYVDNDGKGIAGLEHYLSKSEEQEPKVILTLDARVQHILRSEIEKTIKNYDAKGGAGVILTANTGEVIAMASLPDFNPNQVQFATDKEKFNRATLGLYEFGSVMKVFTLAAGLDSGAISACDEFDVSSPIVISKYTIKDFHPPKKNIYTVSEVLRHSSNIGMAQIALSTGVAVQMDYFEKLNFLGKLNIQIPEKSTTLKPKKLDTLTAITLSYGYGMSPTLLHVAQALTALVNKNGCNMPTTLLKKSGPIVASKGQCKQIISQDTTETMRSLMREVATSGTGRKADAIGYNVGGKTGTGEKSSKGIYDKKLNISSFIGAFPIEKPQYIIAIMIDEPKSQGLVTGGAVAAPIAKNIIESIGPILLVNPVFKD